MKKLIVVAFALMNINAVSQEVIITPEKINEIINYINHFESNEQMMGNISIFENGRELVNKTIETNSFFYLKTNLTILLTYSDTLKENLG